MADSRSKFGVEIEPVTDRIKRQWCSAGQGFPYHARGAVIGNVPCRELHPAGKIIDTDVSGLAACAINAGAVVADEFELAIPVLEPVSGRKHVPTTGAHEQVQRQEKATALDRDTAISIAEGIVLGRVLTARNEGMVLGLQRVSARQTIAKRNGHNARIGVERNFANLPMSNDVPWVLLVENQRQIVDAVSIKVAGGLNFEHPTLRHESFSGRSLSRQLRISNRWNRRLMCRSAPQPAAQREAEEERL